MELNDKEKNCHPLKRLLAKEISEYKQMVPFPLGNGDTHWFQVNARRVKGSFDHLQGAIVNPKPITLHATQPITAETILESMSDGFYLLDDQFHVVYINEVAEGLLQCERGNVIGRGLLDRFAGAIGTAFQYQYERALKEKIVVEFVDYYKLLDTWFQVKVCPLKKGGLAVYFRDVSDRKKNRRTIDEVCLP